MDFNRLYAEFHVGGLARSLVAYRRVTAAAEDKRYVIAYREIGRIYVAVVDFNVPEGGVRDIQNLGAHATVKGYDVAVALAARQAEEVAS